MLADSAAAQSISAWPGHASHGSERVWTGSTHTGLQRHAGKLSDSKISNCILRKHSATSLRHYAQCYLVRTTDMTSIFSILWKFVQWTQSTSNTIQVPLKKKTKQGSHRCLVRNNMPCQKQQTKMNKAQSWLFILAKIIRRLSRLPLPAHW